MELGHRSGFGLTSFRVTPALGTLTCFVAGGVAVLRVPRATDSSTDRLRLL